MGPLVIILLGGAGYALYEKWSNPTWSPISSLLATPSDLRAALAHVRATSVPTPSATAGLDPNMTSAHVSESNTILTIETSVKKLRDFARAAAKLGFENTANAVIAKANAVETAKAAGASDTDVAQASSGSTAVGWDLFAHGVAPAAGSGQKQHDHDVALAKARAAAAAKKARAHQNFASRHFNHPRPQQQPGMPFDPSMGMGGMSGMGGYGMNGLGGGLGGLGGMGSMGGGLGGLGGAGLGGAGLGGGLADLGGLDADPGYGEDLTGDL